MTIQIELESLKNEKDRISIDRREKLEKSLSEKRKEVEELTKVWEQEKYRLSTNLTDQDNNSRPLKLLAKISKTLD
jgi:hypothetical protein